MSTAINRGVESYRRTEVESRTPIELVVLLYDGAIRFTQEARDAMTRRDILARGAAVSRALAIIAELQSTLDVERGGSLATSLDALYDFVCGRLMDASSRQDVGPLDEALRVLTTLRDGWAGAASPTPPRTDTASAG
jgi:flagellar protein FliS